MNRNWTFAVWVLVVVAMVVVAGCGPKEVETPEKEMMEPPATPEPVEVEDEPPMPEPVDDTPDPRDMEVVEAEKYFYEQGLIGAVFFDFDKYDLKPEARERLAKNADTMKKYPEFVFTIEGHCDERGTNEYNIALGERRANAAKDYLMSLGVDGSQMKTVSYGEERPFCTASHDESCWWQNRRAHFTIAEKRG